MRTDANDNNDDEEEDDEEEPLEGTTPTPRSRSTTMLIIAVGVVVVLVGPLLAVLVYMYGGGGNNKPATPPGNASAPSATGPVQGAPAEDNASKDAGPSAVGIGGGAGATLPSAPSTPGGTGAAPGKPMSGGDGLAAGAEAFKPPYSPPTFEAGQFLYQWEAEAGGVSGLALTPDDRAAVLGTTDSIRIVDLESRKEKQRFAEGLSLGCLSLSSDGKRLLTGGGTVETKGGQRVPRDCVVRLWDLSKGKELRKLEGHTRPITTVAFTKDGQRAFSAGGGEDRGENNTTVPVDCGIRVWNLVTYQQIGLLEGHKAPVRCLVLANHDQACISGSSDGTLRFWNLLTGETQQVMQAGKGVAVTSIACNYDGSQAVSGQSDGSVILWNVYTGQALRRFEVPQQTKYVHWVGLTREFGRVLSAHGWIETKDGKTVPVDTTLRCWSLSADRAPEKFSEHTHMVKVAALAQHGNWVVSAGQDRTLRLWRLP